MYPYIGSVLTYTVLYSAAIVLHFVLAIVFCRRFGLRRAFGLVVGVSYVISMVAGARILYDLTHGQHPALHDFGDPSYYMRGGLWGGPLVHLALVATIIVVFIRRRRAAFDVVALALPLPMMLSKIACFTFGCCHGTPTALPWGVVFPSNPGGAPVGVALHPVQLYEAGVLALAFGIVASLRDPKCYGLRLPWFLLIYGIGRPLAEFLRGDAPNRLAVGYFTVSQLLCFATALVATAVLIYGRRRTLDSSTGAVKLPGNVEL